MPDVFTPIYCVIYAIAIVHLTTPDALPDLIERFAI